MDLKILLSKFYVNEIQNPNPNPNPNPNDKHRPNPNPRERAKFSHNTVRKGRQLNLFSNNLTQMLTVNDVVRFLEQRTSPTRQSPKMTERKKPNDILRLTLMDVIELHCDNFMRYGNGEYLTAAVVRFLLHNHALK